MAKRVRADLTAAQARAVHRALSECLDSTSDDEQRAIFGSAQSVRAAIRAYEALGRMLYGQATDSGTER